MGREIKFRGYVRYGVWVYGDLLNETDTDCAICSEYTVMDDFVQAHSMTVAIETIGQYTGLKDKNGKEIYEGDIVKVSEEYNGDAYIPLVVDFKDGCFILRKTNYMKDYMLIIEVNFKQVYEVIGNIYENKNLIGE